MPTEVSYKAGDLRVDLLEIYSLTGVAYDLTNFLVELNLFEDVHSPVLFGSLVIADAVNLISRLPIIGTEVFTVKLRSAIFEDNPDSVISKSFQIYSVADRFLNADREQVYTLHFCSQEAYKDNVSTISKAFSGITSDIVSTIYGQYLAAPRLAGTQNENEPATDLVIGDTPHTSNIKYVSNYWTPLQNISYISKRSIGQNLLGADYLFFETNKRFYYTSLEHLVEQQQNILYDEFFYMPAGDGIQIPRRNDSITYTTPALPDEFIRIEDITLPKTIDALNSYQTGTYGASLRSFDFSTKKHDDFLYDGFDSYNKFYHTDPGNPMPPNLYPNPSAQRIWKPFNSLLHSNGQGYGLYTNPDTTTVSNLRTNHEFDDKVVSRELSRMTYFNSFNQYKFQITIPGRTDLDVGRMIKIVFPSPQVKDGKGQDQNSTIDRLLSGRFLVSAIHHKIDVGQHKMICEVTKNGLNLNLKPEDFDQGEPQ